MTALFLFVFGAPIATFLLFALLPMGPSYWKWLGAFALFWGLAAIWAYRQSSSGPDDFLAGIEMLPLWGSFGAAAVATFARVWDAKRVANGKPSRRGALLITLSLAPLALAFLYFRG